MSNMNRVEIVDIDLAATISDLPRPGPDCAAVCLYFWYAGVPLGDCEIGAASLPVSSSQIRALAIQAILPAVQAWLGRDDAIDCAEGVFEALLKRTRALPSGDRVSIVVCTRNRPDMLAQCLDSIAALDERPFEAIVVDNAPQNSETRAVVDRYPWAEYLPEPRPGLSFARNSGVRRATGDIVAFTDDDVKVAPNWLAQLRQPFANPQVMAVTGLVLPARLDSTAEQLFERQFGLHRGYRRRTFTRHSSAPWEIGAGANMAIRKSAFREVGHFDELLGAGAAGCSEDSEFWLRLLRNGFLCVYTPLAVVRHFHRADMKGLKQQMFAYMRGHTVALAIQFSAYGDRQSVKRLCWTLPLLYVHRLPAILGPRTEQDRLWRGSAAGYLAGFVFYLRNAVWRNNVAQLEASGHLLHASIPERPCE